MSLASVLARRAPARGVTVDWTGRILPALLAAVLGALLVYAAGFAQTEAVHDAAHDTRHSASLPCH